MKEVENYYNRIHEMRNPGWIGVNFGAARLQRELQREFAGQEMDYVDKYNFMRDLRAKAKQEY